AQRRRAPQRVDLAEQTTVVVGERDTADRLRVALREELRDPADRGGHRTATGLGRVRREDGPELELLDAAGRLLRADLLAQLRDGRLDVVVDDDGRVRLTTPQDAHAVVLLGEVDEVEVARERPGDLLGTLERERLDEGLGRLDRRRAVLVVRRDRQRTQTLDVLEAVLDDRLREDLTEHAAEQTDVRAQLVRHLVPSRPALVRLCGGGFLTGHVPDHRTFVAPGA